MLGDLLIVGINGDDSVRALKGDDRPINNENDRARVVAALESVYAVTIFEDVRAVRFLELARPDTYVKGGDYTVETLDVDERRVLKNCGAQIKIEPLVEGYSTTALLKRLAVV